MPVKKVIKSVPVKDVALPNNGKVEICYIHTGKNIVASNFVKYLAEKLKSIDFNKNFLTLNFDGLSMVIDTPNFHLSIDESGMVTFRKVSKPIAIEIYVSIDRLIFISRGPKPEL